MQHWPDNETLFWNLGAAIPITLLSVSSEVNSQSWLSEYQTTVLGELRKYRLDILVLRKKDEAQQHLRET